MVSQSARRHHYVPAFCLGGFTDIGTKSGQLWVHDLVRGKQYPTSPEKVGLERDFNLLETSEIDALSLEDAFEASETRAAPVISSIAESHDLPVGEDLERLLEFITLLAYRTPAVRNSIADSTAHLARLILDVASSSPERWQSFIARFERETGASMTGSYEDHRRVIRTCEIKVHDNDWLRGMTLVGVSETLETMRNRSWSLLVSSDSAATFVTCDHPVSLAWTRDELIGGFYQPGFGLNDTRVSIPLTKTCFMMGEYDRPSVTARADQTVVALMNAGTALCAQRFLASPFEEFPWHDGTQVRVSLDGHHLFQQDRDDDSAG